MNSKMEKEIFEQSAIIGELLDKNIKNYCVLVDFPSKVSRIKFIASGSSFNCANLGEKFFRDIADIDATCEFASEFLASKDQKIDPDTLYFFISQSGETVDTVEVMDRAKKCGAKTFAVVNNPSSYMYENADFSLCAQAGKEESIAATKSFTACVLCVWLCALKAAQNKSKDISKYLENTQNIAKDMDETLLLFDKMDKPASFLSKYKSFPIVGYDYYFALAKEGALKIKETSYTDSNAYALGEFIHGHVALLNSQSTCIEIFSKDMSAFEIKNLRKIEDGYNPKVIAITDFQGKVNAEYVLPFKETECVITRVLCVALILQLLALKIAYKLKCDVDNPKGLSKVVL